MMMISPIELLHYQVEKYTALLPAARNIKERMWRRAELYRLKNQLKKHQ